MTAYAARQVYVRSRINLRSVAGDPPTYGSTLYFSENTRKARAICSSLSGSLMQYFPARPRA